MGMGVYQRSPEQIERLRSQSKRAAAAAAIANAIDPMERIERQTLKTDACHLWVGYKVDGYGKISIDGKTVTVTRFLWKRKIGPIPPGVMVCHRCDNPPCIRLDHLFLGTPADNARDASAKGRLKGSGRKPGVLHPPECGHCIQVRSAKRDEKGRILHTEKRIELI